MDSTTHIAGQVLGRVLGVAFDRDDDEIPPEPNDDGPDMRTDTQASHHGFERGDRTSG
ncbi:hypothetical protein [Streptomyces uncialis]|uniref:hypothetical protein n=1 Tax=Streptomyces uncialis TaxID=1048205 RepID=UPI0033D62D65